MRERGVGCCCGGGVVEDSCTAACSAGTDGGYGERHWKMEVEESRGSDDDVGSSNMCG